MDKLILKRIAKEWAAGVLYHGTGNDQLHDTILTDDEIKYVTEEVRKIAIKIWNEEPHYHLNSIIGKYYEIK